MDIEQRLDDLTRAIQQFRSTRTAIVIDGSFFLKRFRYVFPDRNPFDAETVARTMHEMALKHIEAQGSQLYRIFYYDCPPLTVTVESAISKNSFDFSQTKTAQFRTRLLNEIKKKRKVALRLGRLDENGGQWKMKGPILRQLLEGELSFQDLNDTDFEFDARQKGVDMRIGLDIASMAYKRQVDQIILIAGDSDFVPAAKMARREGIDIILDPLWAPIQADLNEHIDGLQSVAPRPTYNKPPYPNANYNPSGNYNQSSYNT
ncbi:MAG: NYN domain-containing protein [bacterium]|nr:NYN domain-containing protein [bacterium]